MRDLQGQSEERRPPNLASAFLRLEASDAHASKSNIEDLDVAVEGYGLQ
jgi:hypothetical protein